MYRGVAHVCGYFTLALAVLMLVPAGVDLAVDNPDWQAFVGASVLAGVPSALLIVATQGNMPPITLRFGFLVVNFVWVSTSLVAALPLLFSAQGLSFTDAVFEAASGITTTGSTVISGLDSKPPGFLLWRSMMQWMGGLGIIAMGLLLLPFLRVGGMQIYRLESSAQSDNPFPRFTKFSSALVSLYLGMSVACAFGYAMAGMSPFDAINHAMTKSPPAVIRPMTHPWAISGPGCIWWASCSWWAARCRSSRF